MVDEKKEEPPEPPVTRWACNTCQDGSSCEYLGPKPLESCEEHPELTPKWKAVK